MNTDQINQQLSKITQNFQNYDTIQWNNASMVEFRPTQKANYVPERALSIVNEHHKKRMSMSSNEHTSFTSFLVKAQQVEESNQRAKMAINGNNGGPMNGLFKSQQTSFIQSN